jgi:hypothetical protein
MIAWALTTLLQLLAKCLFLDLALAFFDGDNPVHSDI